MNDESRQMAPKAAHGRQRIAHKALHEYLPDFGPFKGVFLFGAGLARTCQRVLVVM